jgi:hypothetical protein
MKDNCLEIFNKVGEHHLPLKPVAEGEDFQLDFYDASKNDYPKDCLYAFSFDEIVNEKNLAMQHKYTEIPERKMYLWVLKDNQIRMVPEKTPVKCKREHASHPNLTGGKEAIIGGELWFLKNADGNIEVHLNLDSGRYTARNVPSQFPEVMKLFECVGYTPKKLVV